MLQPAQSELRRVPNARHDAEVGWDILQGNVFPIEMLRRWPPDEITRYYLGGVTQIIDSYRHAAVEQGLGGEPYHWNESDFNRLLIRSLA
ncbi:MAG: hypothetical protein U5R31_13245 [Acidimicrobiia bacterium]|nr:hypothetical protein [Acidimicrobiia bacterium]